VRRSALIALAVLLALAALIVYSSLRVGTVECEVCLRYDGRVQCRTAAAADRETAIRSATTSACATLAAGRAASMECERTAPDVASCR
jgi:hypothetical protein